MPLETVEGLTENFVESAAVVMLKIVGK